MILTKKYIMANRTDRGAWTRPQIEALGIEWPPRKGWIDRVIGNEISSENRLIFESKVGIKEARRIIKRQAIESLDLELVTEQRKWL